ncbi:SDR family oxidoreductase [Aquimarina pacifica]|uniref:SDR family oxidoreductase n=1 Tax=Aquimarina pacifica TaxID=1296415 RepID=UPI00047299ED|nr:SDR family oxidoreductase [Aquimarina pacifica]
MNIILTGATGTLGSKVLYEFLTDKFDEIEKIYLFVRKKGNTSPESRIKKVITSEYAPDTIKKNLDAVLEKIKVITSDDFLNPAAFLSKEETNYFIHSAGYVNLSVNPDQEDEIFNENFGFTKKIFNSYVDYLHKFIYISTAFSIGNMGGVIDNDYLKKEEVTYRNYYEKSKHTTEKFLVEASKEKNIPIQILRPSVLGGNIIDTPTYFISKYMVFYLFAKFFYRSASDDSIRIAVNAEAGLNIIPTDYAAKVIVKVFESDIEQLNIVHSKGTNLLSGMSKIMETVGFNNFSVAKEAVDSTAGYGSLLEKFYYETIGVHLAPYLTSKPYEWDTTLLESILPIPEYDLEEYLVSTIKFAKTKEFRNEKW